MLHRAILGTLERFMGIYIEHSAAKFPVWLAPEHVVLVTVSEKQSEYARGVQRELAAKGIRAELDDGSDKLGAKIRKARLLRVPYIGVIGEKEAESRTVAPRSRDEDRDLGPMGVEAFATRILSETKPPRLSHGQRATG
jgi:threonyl-tRNA synthetase